MKTLLLRLVAAGVLLGPAGLLPHANEAHPPAATTRVLSFTHLWADANGVSHFRDEKLSFEAATPENPTAGTSSRKRAARDVTFFLRSPGRFARMRALRAARSRGA